MARDQMSEIAEILANDGTEWKFNPPGAPHFGGLWEAGIKCFKYHFRRIIGETLLTYEEFLTLIVQIEACLNSRPLGPISGDPNDLAVLTPAHFLLTSSSSCVPEEDLLTVGVQLLPRWKMVQKMVQHLWRQWSTDYIHNLQQRHKWRMPRPNVATGSLVLVREEHVPPAKWIMGRVVEIHPGKDGLVRVVSIRTKAGILKRPLLVLPCARCRILRKNKASLSLRSPAVRIFPQRKSGIQSSKDGGVRYNRLAPFKWNSSSSPGQTAGKIKPQLPTVTSLLRSKDSVPLKDIIKRFVVCEKRVKKIQKGITKDFVLKPNDDTPKDKILTLNDDCGIHLKGIHKSEQKIWVRFRISQLFMRKHRAYIANHRRKNKLNFAFHIEEIVSRTLRIKNFLFSLCSKSWGLSSHKRITLYKSLFRSTLTYGSEIWFKFLNKKSIQKLNSMQYQILIWSIQAYKTTSYNCVHSLAKTPLIADYIEAKNMKYDLNNLSFEDKQKYNIDIPFIIKSYIDERMLLLLNNTNETFTSFFNRGIPNYFRPNFHNTQFVTNHGNFGSFLERIRTSEDPGCFCGCRIQDSTHLLLKCPAFQDYRLNNCILCTDPRELISSRDSYIVLKEDKKQESSKMETNKICALIKYLCKKGMSPKEIYEDMVDTLREDAPSYSTVKKWVAAFKLGRISTEDEHRPGRPVESVTQENIDKIHVLVMLDRRMTVRRIEETLGI
ncbi:hypothetical protein LAZ67_7002111 [Cordylochernes scorpioides]|uniref:DUF5641 domain-containing protein n=1 Tax=Cordylochernes scorpioides TaxID=51811 RepID=A0ABY6KSV8_9ARAC|nr:hypothetical protein LAZ67_7002111 [Cordylochernes scorpioides]